MPINVRLPAILIIGQRKAFYWQKIPHPNCVQKEVVNIDILMASRNDYRKSMQPIKITNGPPMYTTKEMEPVQQVQLKIYQDYLYIKDFD